MSTYDMISGLTIEPIIFLSASAIHLPGTLWAVLLAQDWSALTSFHRFSNLWFGRVWATLGPLVRKNAELRVEPLLQGRVKSGTIINGPSDSLSPGVSGTVIEIGPGSGQWVSIFGDKYLTAKTDQPGGGERGIIKKVYGIEPNPDMHPLLANKIKEAGLEGTYQIVPAGIQDIGRTGLLQKGSVDAIVTVLTLCSIPDPDTNVKELYEYLKPGGKWYVYEHVRTYPKQGIFMKYYQKTLNLVWPTFFGGCQMCRDTESTLRAAGKWKDIDLAMPSDQPWWSYTPHTFGIMTKAD